ncbi:glycoside hydrolase [Amylostereum chailletii]|nr:glycoside hydrolase [Amylostereum chailletii]
MSRVVSTVNLTLVLLLYLPFVLSARQCPNRSTSLSASSAVKTTSTVTGSSTSSVTTTTKTSSSTSTSTSKTTNATTATETISGFISMAWYPAWHNNAYPPSSVSWSKYSAMIYAFASTTSDVNTIGLESSDQALLPQFVKTAHANGVLALLSIGGWEGSRYFSTAVATSQNRTKFAQAVVNVVNTYNLDGVDFDWETPAVQGEGDNTISPQDSPNYLLFLKKLRTLPGAESLLITAAVLGTTFVGSDGTHMSDVSGFAGVLDYIAIMNYDIWGSWSSSVGPNAPLADSCASTSHRAGSATSAVASWTAAGFPKKQIVLGVPAYGHAFVVSASDALTSSGGIAAYPPFDTSLIPTGNSWGGTMCGAADAQVGTYDFFGLIQCGFLTSKGTAANGLTYKYDLCSQTPYVYNSTSNIMVSYDDAASFAAKGSFIKDECLAGFAMWQSGGDSNDILLNSVKASMGTDAPHC